MRSQSPQRRQRGSVQKKVKRINADPIAVALPMLMIDHGAVRLAQFLT
jgi:hypothetical protein